MLESIRSPIDIPVTDAILVTRDERIAQRNHRLLIQQARDRAKDCIEQANQDAEAIRAHAFQEGYCKGVLLASEGLSELLLRSSDVSKVLQVELLDVARKVLGDCLKNSQVIETILDHWLDRLGEGQPALEIVLPLRCKSELPALKAELQNKGISAVDINFHEEERYLFRVADQVMVLDIGATQEQLTQRLMMQLKALPNSVRQLNEQTRQALIKWGEQLVEISPVSNDLLEVDQINEYR